MNAGMYHEDRSPVGLYVENGRQLKKLSTADGPGNFSMKPNGVFYVDGAKAGVMETKEFARRKLTPAFATQSGPMLVINGRLHPRFLANATSQKPAQRRRRRRQQGDIRAGRYARHLPPIRARVPRRLEDANALYLDGSISRLYATDIDRDDVGFLLGPIVAVSAPRSDKQQGASKP